MKIRARETKRMVFKGRVSRPSPRGITLNLSKLGLSVPKMGPERVKSESGLVWPEQLGAVENQCLSRPGCPEATSGRLFSCTARLPRRWRWKSCVPSCKQPYLSGLKLLFSCHATMPPRVNCYRSRDIASAHSPASLRGGPSAGLRQGASFTHLGRVFEQSWQEKRSLFCTASVLLELVAYFSHSPQWR